MNAADFWLGFGMMLGILLVALAGVFVLDTLVRLDNALDRIAELERKQDAK